MSSARDVVRVSMLRGAVPSVRGGSAGQWLAAGQGVVDELAEHRDLRAIDVARLLSASERVPLGEAKRFVATAMALLAPGAHGSCRLRPAVCWGLRHG